MISRTSDDARPGLDALAPGEVDIWIARPSALDDPALYAACDALLSADERAKQRAFVFERNQRESLMTRALVRSALSRYRPVDPAAWQFVLNPYGRPYIDPPCGLSFNLSNHPTLVVCGVTESVEVGVDLEPISRGPTILDLAPSVFAPQERHDLERLDASARLDRAVTLWTLKESYVKARGQGLALPLDAFAFDLRDAEPRITFQPPLEDDPQRWWFGSFDFDHHRIALTVERAAPTPPLVRLRPCVPCGLVKHP
jgi:4'-phosphopantetheinyl transferase